MIFRKSLSIVIMFTVIVLIACEKKGSSVKANPEAEKIAVEAADKWLNPSLPFPPQK